MKRSLGSALAMIVIAVAIGCDTTTPTQVLVFVDADEALTARIARVRAEVIDHEGSALEPIDVTLEAGTDARLPLRIPLIPRGGDPARTYELHIAVFERGRSEPLATQEIRGGYVEDELREVWVVFDEACAGLECPGGLRCQQGECVERCVAPAALGAVTRSGPAPCPEGCAPMCSDGRILACRDELHALGEACLWGCADASQCAVIVPSNVGDVARVPTSDLAPLPIETLTVWNTDDGSITGVRNPGEGDAASDPNGIGFRVVEREDGASYGVFSVARSLVVRARWSAEGSRPMVVLIGGDLTLIDAAIDGRAGLSLAGVGEASSGDGGGGGGTFGGPGGRGGDGATSSGARAGMLHGTEALIPLVAGSPGGSAGTEGGVPGGAVQITATGRITLMGVSSIDARGQRGGSAVGAQSTGGGGSGGGILLECDRLELGSPGERVVVTGGFGGDLEGGEDTGGGGGGWGSPEGQHGTSGALGTGGGGGSGRIRINVREPEGLDLREYTRPPMCAYGTPGACTIGAAMRGAP